MQRIVNLSSEVTLLRYNSGVEVIVRPNGRIDVAESEISGNAMIAKLQNEKRLDIREAKAPDPGSSGSDGPGSASLKGERQKGGQPK
jgi:hypothetical protein